MTRNMVKSGLVIAFVACAVVIFQNCSAGGGGGTGGGGGGSASTLSGVAVAGAPIVGTVTLKDSGSPAVTKFSLIDANGNYTIDVTGLTPPFMLRADGTVGGRSYSIYSGATLADINGNINITPLTDLIVANVAGQLASTYFTNGNFSTLTTTELNTQQAALQARLLPILTAVGVSGSIDLLRTAFSADHTGLDAALDVIRVEVNTATSIATITSIINNQIITDNLASQADATVIDATGVASGITDVQAIMTHFSTFTSLFATTLPSGGASNATLQAMFDAGFLFDGDNRAAFLGMLATDPTMIGIKFNNVSIVEGSLLPANGSPTAASVVFRVIQGGVPMEDMIFNLVKSGGIWKITGNGRIGKARVLSFARLQDTPSPNSIDTGLLFEIEDSGGAGFDYAIVSGPGLPAHTPGTSTGGVMYFAKAGNSFATAAIGTAYNGSSTTAISSFGHNQIPLGDGSIALIDDNSEYTIEFFEDNGTTATGNDTITATFTSTLGRRPYLSSELAVASFAPVLSPTTTQLGTFGTAGGTIGVTWTIPSGLFPSHLHYFRTGNGSGTNSENSDINLTSTSTSENIIMTAINTNPSNFGTLVSSGFNLTMKDAFSRELTTIFNGQ